ncbi:TMEM175 family protein [Lactobacillus selangorensis]|uniref:TMEM175 family protein n=1 Tax=Lactobacillus selangorensis TaxID=81857 RepID=UPI000B05EAA4|nr:TMEM175 family protein [Lactobacillus selangorensis]
MTTGRLQAFSDGVFAILITILVLDFKIPTYTAGHLLPAVLKQWPILAAYLVSYFYVGTLWLFHHDYFKTIALINRDLNVLNLILLFSVTLLAYPTSLVATTLQSGNLTDIRTALVMYDLVGAFISLTFVWLYNYMCKHPELKAKNVTDQFYQQIKHDPYRSVSIYVVALVVTFFSVVVGGILLLAGIWFHYRAYRHMNQLLESEKKKTVLD